MRGIDDHECRRRSTRTITLVLAVIAAVLLVAVAGMLALVLNDRTNDLAGAATQSTVTSTATDGMSLREAAQGLIAESTAAVKRGGHKAGLRAVEEHAVPECADLIKGLIIGGTRDIPTDDLTGPSTLVSVTESGDRGTTVIRADGEDETRHWDRSGGVWRLTCEGLLDDSPAGADTEAGQSDSGDASDASAADDADASESRPTTPTPEAPQGPAAGDACIGAETGKRTTDADGQSIVCDNYTWAPDVGQTPRHKWADDQSKWADCTADHTTEECREELNGTGSTDGN